MAGSWCKVALAMTCDDVQSSVSLSEQQLDERDGAVLLPLREADPFSILEPPCRSPSNVAERDDCVDTAVAQR